MSISGAVRKPPCPAVTPSAAHSPRPAVPGLQRGPALRARSIQVSQGFGGNSLRRTCFTSRSPPVNNSSSTGGGGELPWAEWEEAGSQGSKTVIKTPPSGCSPALSKEHGRLSCSFQPSLDILDGAVTASPSCPWALLQQRALMKCQRKCLKHGEGSSFWVLKPCARRELRAQPHPMPGPNPSPPWAGPMLTRAMLSFKGQV